MKNFWNGGLKFTFLTLALFCSVGNAIAEAEPTSIKLNMSEGSVIVRGQLASGKRITYLLTPKINNSNVVIQLKSSRNEVGFTVWDTGSHLAMPLQGESRKPLLGVIKEEMEEIYLPNLTWQGHLINREHMLIISNEGEKESSFSLTVVVQE